MVGCRRPIGGHCFYFLFRFHFWFRRRCSVADVVTEAELAAIVIKSHHAVVIAGHAFHLAPVVTADVILLPLNLLRRSRAIAMAITRRRRPLRDVIERNDDRRFQFRFRFRFPADAHVTVVVYVTFIVSLKTRKSS